MSHDIMVRDPSLRVYDTWSSARRFFTTTSEFGCLVTPGVCIDGQQLVVYCRVTVIDLGDTRCDGRCDLSQRVTSGEDRLTGRVLRGVAPRRGTVWWYVDETEYGTTTTGKKEVFSKVITGVRQTLEMRNLLETNGLCILKQEFARVKLCTRGPHSVMLRPWVGKAVMTSGTVRHV